MERLCALCPGLIFFGSFVGFLFWLSKHLAKWKKEHPDDFEGE